MGKVHPPLLWLCFPRQSVRAKTHSGNHPYITSRRERIPHCSPSQAGCNTPGLLFIPPSESKNLPVAVLCCVVSLQKHAEAPTEHRFEQEGAVFWRSAAFFSNDLEWGCFNLQMAGICNPWLLLMGLEMFSCIRDAGSRPLSYVMFSLRPALLISCCLCMQLGLNQLLRACLHGRAKVFTHGWLRAKKNKRKLHSLHTSSSPPLASCRLYATVWNQVEAGST